jgi:hypothetical protein
MATPTKLVLSLHNGKTAQPLNPGQPNLVKAHAGEHYRVLRDVDGKPQLAGDVLAKRHGDDLQLDYADGTQVTLQDYYVQCKGAAACEATLPASNGGSHVVSDDAGGVAAGDGSTLVYAWGSHDTLMGMVQDDAALGSALGGLHGGETSYAAPSPSGWSQMGASGASGATGSGDGGASSGLTALGILAGGAFVAVAASGISGGHSISKDSGGTTGGSPPGAATHSVSGTVAAGPVIAGNDLVVNLYQADGVTQIGTGKVDDSGHYRIDIGSYSGPVIAKLGNGSAADYVDQTTGQARNVSANLMAAGVSSGDTLVLNINLLTTVAATKAGAGFSGVSTTALSERTISDANTGVAAAFGLADLIGGDIVATVTATGAANPAFTADDLSAAEKYGAVLAALSGIDAGNSDIMQATLDAVIAGTLGTGSGGVLSASLADALIGGSGTASARFGTNTLPRALSNLLAEGGATITINDVAGDNIIGATEAGTTLSGTVAAGAKVTLSIGGADRTATVNGTTWSYTLTATDLAAMGQGGETIAPMATLADGSTATARRTVAIDTIAPAAIISEDVPASGSGPVTFTFTFSEPVSGFDASDLVLSGGATKGAFTAISPTKYTLQVTPGTGGADALTVSMAAGAAHDVLGNASKAVSSLDFGFGSTIKLANIASGKGGFVINGENAADLSGLSVSAAGDVNGDGLADLIIGSRDNDANGNNSGRAYVVFGKTDNAPVNLSDIVAGKGGFAINGGTGLNSGSTTYGEEVGISVSSVGDLNGDGLADLLVGAPRAGYTTGRAYVVFGKADTSAVNVASLGSAGYQYFGISSASFGNTVAGLGDVNGDGLNDLMIGLPGYDSSSGLNNGRAVVIFGAPTAWTASTVMNSGAAYEFGYTGATKDDALGGTVPTATTGGGSLAAAGDFNGDGLADVIVGVGDADPNGTSSGRAYVIYGRTNIIPPGGTTTTNSTSLADVSKGLGGFAIDGLAASDYFGASATGVGDVNGDGLADLLIGARGTDVDGKPDAGRSYVIFGRTGATTSVALSDLANGIGGFVINGQSSGDASGYKVAAAGDVNGDGLADMLVSANAADTAGGADAGRTYVVFGTSKSAPIELSAVATGHGGFVIDGATGTDQSGASVAAAGDINGDGLADLIVSSAQADPNGLANAGATYVIFGATGGAFATTVDQVAGSGHATLTGTGASETLLGDATANTLLGNGGADVLYGGAGNDTIVVNAGNIAALSTTLGGAGNVDQLARVDGGSGIDTLRLDGGGIAFDLGAIGNAGQVGGINMSRISSIERIDLTGSGNNTLKLTMADVVDMAGMNSFNSGNGWTGLGATEARHQLVIDGNAGDQVNSTGWTDTGKSATFNGHTYEIYTQGSYAELLVDQSITRVLA